MNASPPMANWSHVSEHRIYVLLLLLLLLLEFRLNQCPRPICSGTTTQKVAADWTPRVVPLLQAAHDARKSEKENER